MTVSNQPKKTLSGYYAETNILIQSIIANRIQINTFNTAGVILNTSDGTLYSSIGSENQVLPFGYITDARYYKL